MASGSITVDLPDRSTIVRRGIPVSVAPRHETWSTYSLGEQRKEQGVYVIRHGKTIKYVGKTEGRTMSFGARLRRHLQENAAGKHTYSRLAALPKNRSIHVSLYGHAELIQWIRTADAAQNRMAFARVAATRL